MRVLITWLLPLGILATAGCSRTHDATQILTVLYTNLTPGTELTRVKVQIVDADAAFVRTVPESAVRSDREWIVGGQSDGNAPVRTLPFSFAIAPPNENQLRDFRVVVTGYGPLGSDGEEIAVIQQMAKVGYRKQEKLLLEIFLWRPCLQELCEEEREAGEDSVCRAATGRCAEVPTPDLPEAGDDPIHVGAQPEPDDGEAAGSGAGEGGVASPAGTGRAGTGPGGRGAPMSGAGGANGASGSGGINGASGSGAINGASGSGGSTTPEGPTLDICGTEVGIGDYLVPGGEFIIDLATIALNADTNPIGAQFGATNLQAVSSGLPWVQRSPGCTGSGCFDRLAYEDQVIEGGGVHVAALLGLSYAVGVDGSGSSASAVLTNEDLASLWDRVGRQVGAEHVLFVPSIMPNDRIALQLQQMDRWAAQATAFQMNPAWSPSAGGGFALSDPTAEMVIQRGIAIGVPIFMVRKGMPQSGQTANYTDPSDVGPAAARFGEAKFLVMQAGFEFGFDAGQNSRPQGSDDLGWGSGVGRWPEGPYDANSATVQELYPVDRGVNALITSLRTAGVEPNQNVYVVLSGVWAELLTRPNEAAHLLGKLMQYVGEDNVLWGTDSLIYGSPQPQIEAFRNFEIPAPILEEYGYLELTRERKAKIFGLNAARLLCVIPEP